MLKLKMFIFGGNLVKSLFFHNSEFSIWRYKKVVSIDNYFFNLNFNLSNATLQHETDLQALRGTHATTSFFSILNWNHVGMRHAGFTLLPAHLLLNIVLIIVKL